jgi:20S proteasome alpha/beta subunit
MTLLIGARCKEGIILGADRKSIGPGSSFSYSTKILQLTPPNYLLATAGVVGLADAFIEMYESRIREVRPVGISEIRFMVEDVLRMCSNRYKESLPPWERDIVGILAGPGKDGPEGYRIIGGLPAEKIRNVPVFVGAGEEYAAPFACMLDPNLGYVESAETVAWIITYVSRLCYPVGFEENRGPDIVVITDDKIRMLSRKKVLEIVRKTNLDGKNLREFLPKITKKQDFTEFSSNFFV